MANDTTKTIKLVFQTDTTSLTRTRDSIKALEQDVLRLVKGLRSVGGGQNQGLFGGLDLSKAGNSKQNITVGASKTVGGMLTAGLTADANMFKAVADGSKRALGEMEKSLRASAGNQIRELKNLQNAIEKTTDAYENMSRGGGIGGNGAAYSPNYSGPGAGPNVGGWGPGGFTGKAGAGFFYQGQSPLDSGSPLSAGYRNHQKPPFMDRMFGGMVGSLISSPVGAAGAILAGANTVANMGVGFMNRYAQNSIVQGTYATEMAGRSGAALGNYAFDMSNRHGINLAKAKALDVYSNSSNLVMGTFGKDATEARRWMKAQEIGGTGLSAAGRYLTDIANPKGAYGSILGNLAPQLSQQLQSRVNEAAPGFMSGGAPIEAALSRGMLAVQVEQREQMSRSLDDIQKSDPRLYNRLQEFGATGLQRWNFSRSMGMGFGKIRSGGQTFTGNKAEWAAAQALRRGWDQGQLAGANQALFASGGEQVRGQYESMLNKQAGGLFNAAELMGGSAQFGIGGKNAYFMDALANKGGVAGAGGIGGVAANILGQTVLGQMNRGFGSNESSAVGLMQGLSAFGNTGSGAGDIRFQRNMQQGLGLYEQMFTGQTDNLQMAINTLVSNKVGAKHGLNFYGERALRNLTPEQMIGAMRNGDSALSEYNKKRGITADIVREQFEGVTQWGAARYIDRTGPKDSTIDSFARSVRGMSITDAAKNFIGNKKGTDARAAINDFATNYATMMEDTVGGAPDFQKSSILAMLAGDKGLAPTLRGAGIGGAGIDDATKAALGAQADRAGSEVKETGDAKFRSEVIKLAKGINASADVTGEFSKNLAASGVEFIVSLRMMTDAINTATTAIGQMRIK